jgi:DNA-binding NarL/FixJ family response regulator
VKDAPAERLASAVRQAAGGERVVDPELAAAALADGESPLTTREREVLEAAADGSPTSEIAERRHLSEGTVRNYLSSAIRKTGARNSRHGDARARHHGTVRDAGPSPGRGLTRSAGPRVRRPDTVTMVRGTHGPSTPRMRR